MPASQGRLFNVYHYTGNCVAGKQYPSTFNFVAFRVEIPRKISIEHAEPIFKLTISTSM